MHNNNGFNAMLTNPPIPEKTSRERFQAGDNVKRYEVESGWRFGKVTGIFFDQSNRSWSATVQWIGGAEGNYPQAFLEWYAGEPSEQQTTVIKFTDKDSGELLQTMSESNYRRNACLTWSAREMPIEQIIDAFNETSLTVRGEVCR